MLKSVICGVFITFPLFKVFNNIHEYVNLIICTSGHGMKANV